MKILLGTGNRNKADEIKKIWHEVMAERGAKHELVMPWNFTGDAPDPDENGATLRQNAFIKAREFAEHFQMPAISDDTGLFVDALDGAPGIYAARYAGEGCSYDDNVQKMLLEMEGIPEGDRTARFMCIACLARPGEDKTSAIFAQGVLEGAITEGARGSGGFGYDPIFLLAEGRTLSELSADEKNSISHRGKAMRSLFNMLCDLG